MAVISLLPGMLEQAKSSSYKLNKKGVSVEIIVPKITQATVARDGIEVLIVMDERRVLALPWNAALELARAMTIQAKRIEEQVKALQIIDDQALLMRSGAPFGLTSHPDLINAAKKEAVNNPKLRKYVTGKRAGGIGGPIIGTPTIIRHKRKLNEER